MTLRGIKAIYQKIWQNVIMNLDQKKKVRKKRNIFNSVSALYEDLKLTLNVFRSGIFPIKAKKSEGLKILTPKEMLQRLPITPA